MDIVLRIGDKSLPVHGVTEKTTCSDVIKMALCKFINTKDNTHSYALFECDQSKVRMLSDKTRVLKAMRTWGPGNSKHLSLKAVRKDDNVIKAKLEKTKKTHGLLNNLDITSISDSSKANDRVCQTDFVGANEIRNVDENNCVKYATKKILKHKRVSVINGNTNARTAGCGLVRNLPRQSTPNHRSAKGNLKSHDALAEDIFSKIAQVDQRERKDIILQKYFSDYLAYNSPHKEPFPLPKRQRGDGAEDNSSNGNPDKGDGSFSTSTPLHSNMTRARRHSDSDSGQDDDGFDEILDNAFVCKTVTEHGNNNYKYATIKRLPRKLVDYDITMATKADKLVDYSVSDSSVNENVEDTVDILERNVFVEDDEMASFMDSKLQDDFSDEGLSSWGSDDEH